MVAWAEELGAEATTVTELLEEDNEEVCLGALVVDGYVLLLVLMIMSWMTECLVAFAVNAYLLQVKLEIMAQIQKVNRKAISNAQKVDDKVLLNPGFSQVNLVVGAQVYDRAKRLFIAGRGADSNNEVEEAHCDGDVRKEDSAGEGEK